MKLLFYSCIPLLTLSLVAACSRSATVEWEAGEKFEGSKVEIVNYVDSVVLLSDTVRNGKVSFSFVENDSISFPMLCALMVDGRIKSYLVAEPGNAVIGKNKYIASGTALNDRFGKIMSVLDSIEDLDDMIRWADHAEKLYNENKDNIIGTFLGLEWLKYADPAKVDSMLGVAPKALLDSRRLPDLKRRVALRDASAPGHPFRDFSAEDAHGNPILLSNIITPGKVTLVDFWASWCPYCIKELPDMKKLYSEFGSKDFDIVGVAVRDEPQATRGAVAAHDIPWTVVFNAQRRPYDIYGFSGIPHHILIGRDGRIISSGENIERIRKRLVTLLSE